MSPPREAGSGTPFRYVVSASRPVLSPMIEEVEGASDEALPLADRLHQGDRSGGTRSVLRILGLVILLPVVRNILLQLAFRLGFGASAFGFLALVLTVMALGYIVGLCVYGVRRHSINAVSAAVALVALKCVGDVLTVWFNWKAGFGAQVMTVRYLSVTLGVDLLLIVLVVFTVVWYRSQRGRAVEYPNAT